MNFENLKSNIIYVIKESQIKIGYTFNPVSLNYPLDSLNRFLGTRLDEKEMTAALGRFAEYAKPELGEIRISKYYEQFNLTISAEGARYAHENISDSGFLTEFISLMKSEKKALTIEDILHVFKKYNPEVSCEEADDIDFNYVIRFKNGVPDNFVYCIELHPGHVWYHRLAPEDFETL